MQEENKTEETLSLSQAVEIILNVESGNEVETIEGILSTYILP